MNETVTEMHVEAYLSLNSRTPWYINTACVTEYGQSNQYMINLYSKGYLVQPMTISDKFCWFTTIKRKQPRLFWCQWIRKNCQRVKKKAAASLLVPMD